MEQSLKAPNLDFPAIRRSKFLRKEMTILLDENKNDILFYPYSSEEEDPSDDEGDSYSPIPDLQSDRPQQAAQSPALSATMTKSRFAIAKAPCPQVRSQSPETPSYPPQSPLKYYISQPVTPKPLSTDLLDTYQGRSSLSVDDIGNNLPIPEPDTISPIEIATPILYSVPHVRPSMISIKTSAPHANSNTPPRPLSMPHPPPVPARSKKRVSTMSVRSATSHVDYPTIPLPALPAQLSKNVQSVHSRATAPRPTMVSVKTDSTLPHGASTYDVFPPRPRTNSSQNIDLPTRGASPPPNPPACRPQQASEKRRISSLPTVPSYPESKSVPSPPREVPVENSTSTLHHRRSSIGLALRNVSSSFRTKSLTSRPTTASSSGSAGSKDGIDVSAFPLPPPPLVLQHTSGTGSPKTSCKDSPRSSRIRKVRMTMGF